MLYDCVMIMRQGFFMITKNKLLKKDKPSLVGVSLVAVFLATIVLNEVVKSPSLSVQARSRQIASLNESEIKKEISWEQGWAKQVSAGNVKGKMAVRPSLQDELLYGALEGRYNVQFHNGKIVSLELSEASSSNPVAKINPLDFLQKYKTFFSDKLQSVKMTESKGEHLTFDLIGNNNQILGKALVELNSEGQVKKLNIKNL